MKRALNIFVAFAVLLSFLACSNKETRVIPRGKMAKIYAEMLMMDQFTLSDTKYRQLADTTLVYEPIFRNYGYDTDDYRLSVEYYMNDPERYSRILRATIEIIDKRITELKARQKMIIRHEEIMRFVTDFDISEYYPYLASEPYVHYYDSLDVQVDTMSTYRLVDIERRDTVFDRLVMIVPGDSLEVEPSVTQEDSLAGKPVLGKVLKRPSRMPELMKHSVLDSLKRK